MDRATQLDPQFVLPQVFNVGTIGGSLRDCPRADSLAGALGRSSSRLAVGDEALLKLQVTHCHQDQQAVYDATTILLRVAPGVSEWVNERVGALMRLHSPLEALALLESADQLRRERPTEWNNARMLLLHLLGRYREALRALAEWRTVSPDDPFNDREELRQLIGLGQVDSVERMLEARLGKSNRYSAAGGDLYAVGLELKAHGYAEAGSRACGRALDWSATRPSGAVARLTVALEFSCAGRWNEARQAYQELLATDSLNLYFRSNAGATAYMAGDRPAAEAADQFLARYDRDSQAVYGRAVLAALRGDLDAAMRYLLWAWDNGITWQRVHRDEHLASLRDDPRFQAMLKPTR
jgi:tetratricopeptide (TPR) repeat protein